MCIGWKEIRRKDDLLSYIEYYGAKNAPPNDTDQRENVYSGYRARVYAAYYLGLLDEVPSPHNLVKKLGLNANGRNVDEVLRVLDALQTDELCPCNWKQGEATL